MADSTPADVLAKYGVPPRSVSAYEGIRDAILSARYPPGTQLNERALAEELGLSRTPVRHAFAKLTAEGFLETVPSVGVFVRKLELPEAVELLEFRRVLEAGAAAMAAERISPEQAAELRELATQIEQCEEQAQFTRKRELELRFHRRVCELAGNRELTRTLSNARTVFLTLSPEHIRPDVSAESGPMLANHVEVARAIASGDAHRASQTMWNHFDNALRKLRDKRMEK